MSKHNTFIEINGQQYNALTGALIHPSSSPVKTIDSIQAPVSEGGLNVVTPTPVVERPEPLPHNAVPHFKPDVSRPGVAHLPAHAPVAASTLMRASVKKPAAGLKQRLRTQTRTDVLIKQPAFSIQVKSSIQTVHPERLKRAAKTAKSESIKKFQPVPASHTRMHVEQSGRAQHIPVVARAEKAVQHEADMFERAIEHATSHHEKPVGKAKKSKSGGAKRRALKVTAASLAVVLVAGFIAYQQSNVITVKMAASRAGFEASMPGYKAAGFRMGAVQAEAGVVAMQYQSNSDDRAYTITQKPSNWDSNSLLNQFVRTTTSDYESLQTGGNTIYVYGQHNATWVSGGVWYQVQSDGALSTEQLSMLASSL